MVVGGFVLDLRGGGLWGCEVSRVIGEQPQDEGWGAKRVGELHGGGLVFSLSSGRKTLDPPLVFSFH
mgnify:CR=1 FL=1